MTRLAAALAAACGLAAGSPAVAVAKLDDGRPSPTVQAAAAARSGPAVLVVTVVNGDTNRRVKGAEVTIEGGRTGVTDASGEAHIRVLRRVPLAVSVRADAYTPAQVRKAFDERRRVTVRVYRPDQQWPMYGAGPRRTKQHGAIALRPPFRVVWSRGLGSLVEFPAVVSDGVAYVANYQGVVWALEMRTGEVLWRHRPPRGKMASSPAVLDGRRLVVHGMDGIVRVLDRRDGRVLRAVRIGSPIESSPVVRDGVDYLGTWDGRVVALDLRTGKIRWTYRSGSKITASAALAGGTLFIGDYGGRLLALDAATGRLRWSAGVGGRIYGSAAVADGRVLVPSSTGGTLTAFTTSGRMLWRVRTGGYVYSAPAVWAGRAYFGSYDGGLYAVSLTSGRVLWRLSAGGRVSGSPVVVAGVVYAGHLRGGIVGADGKTGQVLMRFPAGQYVPVSGNAKFLLLHGYSRVFAVEPAAKRPVRAADQGRGSGETGRFPREPQQPSLSVARPPEFS
jgi:outer membrane protein assembly factor BamB/mRNA-degrading endonuclease toxin of MazEF toxin-antitoxin module